ncbi:hypothetical protein FRC19_004004 [Serendipita sp. 401]|nr:hypothetical protein FRC19_004004 [Serendipita sp. 401]
MVICVCIVSDQREGPERPERVSEKGRGGGKGRTTPPPIQMPIVSHLLGRLVGRSLGRRTVKGQRLLRIFASSGGSISLSSLRRCSARREMHAYGRMVIVEECLTIHRPR